MNEDKLLDAIGGIGDDLIKEAKETKKPIGVFKYIAAAAMITVILVAAIMPKKEEEKNNGSSNNETAQIVENESSTVIIVDNDDEKDETETREEETFEYVDTEGFALVEPIYPELIGFPKDKEEVSNYEAIIWQWKEERRKLANAYCRMDKELLGFYEETMKEFLCNSDGENVVYSPINLYMALSMLTELTDGDSRDQILDLLGKEDVEGVRELSKAMWEAHYSGDGPMTCILGNSVWLNENVSFREDTLKNLSTSYYASAYRGKMGSEEFDNVLRTWLNEQTNGLLSEYVSEEEFDADTILALASTIYYRSKWSEQFIEKLTKKDVFHGAASDMECEFMNDTMMTHYYWGDKFSSVEKEFDNAGSMIFILPDEGVSVDEVLKDKQMLEYTLAPYEWENSKYVRVNLSVPKFDVSSKIDLQEGLNNLGVTDIFDYLVSDFTPITTEVTDLAITDATHAARVKIDEEGCEAAAYTLMYLEGSAMPPDEEVDFVLDRPFIFVITSDIGTPLFIGVVNNV